MLTAGKGSNYQITSTGAVSLAQATGSTPTPDAFGGRLSVTGASVALNTCHRPSGRHPRAHRDHR